MLKKKTKLVIRILKNIRKRQEKKLNEKNARILEIKNFKIQGSRR